MLKKMISSNDPRMDSVNTMANSFPETVYQQMATVSFNTFLKIDR